MHFSKAAARLTFPAALLAGMNILGVPPAYAAPYCPEPLHQWPHKVPAYLAPRVVKALRIDARMARSASYVRCDGVRLMACTVGANRDCFKADTRRHLPGATAWCRAHPAAKVIPLFATGHATIYSWSCARRRAVAGKILAAVDRHGYIAANWKRVP
jgi:hypothetical protein